MLTSFSPSQQVIKIVHEELVKILGSHESELRFANEPPTVILIVGLQGSGKTTSTGKLAAAVARTATARMMVSVDVYRPGRAGAVDRDAREDSAADLRRRAGRDRAARTGAGRPARSGEHGRDVLLVDTAGRLHIDDDLMTELQELKTAAQPGRDPVRGRRHDRPGRRQERRRVPQAARASPASS